MKIRYFFAILIALSIVMASCDETTNPSDEYLIDKTISASTTEQVVESGTEFKMIFPANSVSGDITLKIKKEGSYPAFNILNAKLGSNTYRIKFSGNTAFASPVKIIINYDKSQIPAGKTAAEIIQAYIYAGGNWKLATYQLDETNSKIIISISNLETPKTNKDMPELQEDGDMILSEGTTSETDEGQKDSEVLETLRKTLTFNQMLLGSNASVEKIEFENDAQVSSEIDIGHHNPLMSSYSFNNSDNYKMSWNGNSFNIAINRAYEKPDHVGWKYNDVYNVIGGVSDDGKTLNLSWTSLETENRTQDDGGGTIYIDAIESKGTFAFADLPLSSWVKDGSVTYELTGKAVKNLIRNHTYSWRYFRSSKYLGNGWTSEEKHNFLSFDINDNTCLTMTFYCR